MSRISDILVRARDVLVDTEQERWSDDRLIRLVDEAQKDIARHSKLLKDTIEINIQIGEPLYTLPDNLWLITRATFNDCPIGLTTYDKLDEQASKEVLTDRDYNNYERNRGYNIDYGHNSDKVCWDLTEGSSVESLVYDNRDMREIRTYPIPNQSVADFTYAFESSPTLLDNVYAFTSPFGVMTDTSNNDVTLNTEQGVVTDVNALVYDPLLTGLIPVPVIPEFGVTVAITDPVKTVQYSDNEYLGVVVSLTDYTLNSVYGIATSFIDSDIDEEVITPVYGIVTLITETNSKIKIWFIKLSDTITDINDTLQLSPMFDTALRYFVVGQAFLDDNDIGNREKGADSMLSYVRELGLATDTNALDGVRSPTSHVTTYRSAFE